MIHLVLSIIFGVVGGLIASIWLSTLVSCLVGVGIFVLYWLFVAGVGDDVLDIVDLD